MATTYTGQITVPNSATWAGGGPWFIFYQTSNQGGASAGGTLSDYLDAIVNDILGLTYQLTVGATTTVIDFTYVYTDSGSGDPILLGITNDVGTSYQTAFATTLTATCPTCLELTKSACQSTYTFVAGLTASTDYYVVIENNRNRRYIQQVTTDGSGDFVIDATAPEFPEGFFIPEQFVYTVKVYEDADLTTQADITYNNTVYNCIALSFIYSTTTTSSIDVSVDLWVNDSLDFVIDDTFNTISVG